MQSDWVFPSGGQEADDLLHGAIDLHHHGYPEFSSRYRPRLNDVDELTVCRSAGMRGIVLKSHMWPTVGRAHLLRQMVPGMEVYPSITLNSVVGGFEPIAVESAAEQGARVMFMPTWSARHGLERGRIHQFMGTYVPRLGTMTADRGLTVTDPSNRVRAEVRECLAVAAQYDMLVCTAHISPAESLVLAQCAKDYRIEEIVFTHPSSRSVEASPEQVRDMLQLGAIYEFCINNFMPEMQRLSPRKAMDIIGDNRPEQFVFTTDSFYDSDPPGAEAMRIMIATMLRAGLPAAAMRKMVKTNPERLLKLPAIDHIEAVLAQP
jgi:hypothetical protein